jgi:hypothetical protein
LIVDNNVSSVSRAESEILDAVSNAGTVKLSALIEKLGKEGFANDVVREAAWHLLDQGRIRLTSDRKLVA